MLPALMFGQTAIDAYNLSQSDFKGTARFMSMGGAFTSLGGDLSTLNQNPAGIGVYRSSEIGVTLGLDIASTKSSNGAFSMSKNKTTFNCNNFGYIGAVYTGSDVMPYFNWGASYSRVADFNRAYKGKGAMTGSLSNYIAGYTSAESWNSEDLTAYDSFNPYMEPMGAPWMSILAYNSYLINPTGATSYSGLWNNKTSGEMTFDVHEKGYTDEYSINFGGNFANIVYWGMGFGITDIYYRSSVYYTEDMSNATIPSLDANNNYVGTRDGGAGFGLDSWKSISGSGFNFKIGTIIKPINELRIGLAVHTPTYYNLKQEGWAGVDYGYNPNIEGFVQTNDGYADYFEWKLRTPWRLLTGISGVIGKKAIVSLDYEYRPMQNMTVKDQNGRNWTDVNDDVKAYYNAMSIVRVGAEYRLSPQWSVRAGYQIQTSPSTTVALNGETPVFTSGPDDTETTPSYSFDKSTQYISLGLGYRYKSFYVDAAYVNKQRESQWRAFTPNDYTKVGNNYQESSPHSKINLSSNQIVLSLGVKF